MQARKQFLIDQAREKAKILDKIVFFELGHYGDLHITRNFVRYVIDNIPAKEYLYILTSNSKVFADFPELTFGKYESLIQPFTAYSPWLKIDKTLFVNTSCGTNEMEFYDCTTVQTAYAIFKHYLKKFCKHDLTKDIKYFIPSICFNKFKIDKIDKFMSLHVGKKKILIVNGDTLSGQVLNFDMHPLIQFLSYTYPEYMFFISNVPNNGVHRHNEVCKIYYPEEKNIFYCKDIIDLVDENDIVETAYFSTFCDVIIGRTSGVYTLSIEQRNIIDKPKKFICISFTEKDKDLGVCKIYPELADNFIWTDNFNYGHMLNIIQRNM